MQMTLALLFALLAPRWALAQSSTSFCQPERDRTQVIFQADLNEGEEFSRHFGPNFIFKLVPIDSGWEIEVAVEDREENIARLTPPLHVVPNPRYIEGWHFRNADNSGPNDGSVNAPQELRKFIFSPEVGLSIQGPESRFSPSIEDIQLVESFGTGLLEILNYKLASLEKGQEARMIGMRFRVCLSWPSRSTPHHSQQ